MSVPWAMQIVVRVEKDPSPAHTAVLRATGSAVAVAIAAFTAPDADPEVRERTERWRSGPIRKVVRRARGAGWTRQLAVAGVAVHRFHGVDVAVHVPGPVDEVDPEISRLQVGGLTLEDPVESEPEGAGVRLWLNPHLTLTTGKAAAQVGHAAQLLWEWLPADGAAALGRRRRAARRRGGRRGRLGPAWWSTRPSWSPTAGSPRSRRARSPSSRARSAPAAVRHREDLQDVPVGVVPVEPATAVLVVDLAGLPVERVGPVRQAALLDAAVDGVELLLGDQERIVLRVRLALGVGDVEGDVVGDLDLEERSVGCRLREDRGSRRDGARSPACRWRGRWCGSAGRTSQVSFSFSSECGRGRGVRTSATTSTATTASASADQVGGGGVAVHERRTASRRARAWRRTTRWRRPRDCSARPCRPSCRSASRWWPWRRRHRRTSARCCS